MRLATRILLFLGLAAPALIISADSRCFPDDFLFGSATAAYQVEGAVIEGGRTPSIWDVYCRTQPGLKCANVADDFYHRYHDDVKLMIEMGLQSFRFSVSWSRVMNWDVKTARMRPNPEGLAFYHSLIDELHSNSIVPILTIYHWDLPIELHAQLGEEGWLDPEIIDHYVDYANLLFHEYGYKVNYWSTFNEPLSFCADGYALGRGPPGYTGSLTQVYTAAHNVLLSHAQAVKKFRELKTANVIGEKARIGIVLNGDYAYPLDPTDPADVEAASRKMQFDVGWFLAPLVTGDYPPIMRKIIGDPLPQFYGDQSELLKGSYDLFMLNSYASRQVTSCNSKSSNKDCDTLSPGFEKDRGIDDSHMIPGTRLHSKKDAHCAYFTAYPPAYLEIIKWLHKHDRSADILLTGNGWCGDDEIDNADQLWYFQAYLEQVHKAIADEHIPVVGYLAWSLLDNYEWGSYESRFGLYYVNYTSESGSPDFFEPKPTDLARIPRLSAKWLQKVATSKCLNVDATATAVTAPESVEHSHQVWHLFFGIVAIAVVGFAAVVALVFFIGRLIGRHFRGHENRVANEGTPLL